MKQLRARKQRIVARENAKARKRRTHLIIRLGGILSNEGVLGYDEGVWNDEGNRQRLLDMLKAHAAELRAWASDAGVRLPSAESAGELREQVRDLPQEPQIQEQPGYGYQPDSNSHSNGSSSLGTESVSSLHRGGAPFYRIFCTLLDSPQPYGSRGNALLKGRKWEIKGEILGII